MDLPNSNRREMRLICRRRSRSPLPQNDRVGPRYFSSAELFDGERIFYPTDRSIRSEAQIQREFERAQALDVDNYKTYVRLPHAQQKELMELAHAQRPVSG